MQVSDTDTGTPKDTNTPSDFLLLNPTHAFVVFLYSWEIGNVITSDDIDGGWLLFLCMQSLFRCKRVLLE